MKKTILAIAAILFTAFITKAQTAAPAPAPAPQNTATVAPENPNAPDIIFENENIDYGTIENDADGNREFKFKNKGKEPLIIYSATGSCGCTVPTAPKDPIKPGETGVIKVHYDTKRVGSFEKTVTVSSNAKTPSKTLKIHGTVKAAPTPAGTVTASPSVPPTNPH
ncbi:MAG: DUF1573 domain-containing protein [Bacteroidetes bacterium]|nr:DUF1573 domain-containing protein [Bacteroidota bacterium]